MNAKRLLKLAQFLRTVPKKRYDQDTFGDVKPHDRNFEGHKCGTTACALGWATTIPSFRRAGLVSEFENWDPNGIMNVIYNPTGRRRDEREGFDAAMAFFDLTWHECRALFGDENDTGAQTPKQAARNIEQFVKRKGLSEAYKIRHGIYDKDSGAYAW